jgi:D-glycero-alpha-D-manno-heptose-7-phosphate kinase
MAGALRRGALDDLGALVGEHWVHQRSLHPQITTARIDAIVERATAAGALGVKALGASGGGCVLAVAPAGGEEPVCAAVGALAELLPFTVDTTGFVVVADE